MSKTLIGTVVSTEMIKTCVVEIETRKKHPLYKKFIKRRKRLKAHNEDFKLRVGNKVKIIEVRPLSKEKHFKVLEVIKQ